MMTVASVLAWLALVAAATRGIEEEELETFLPSYMMSCPAIGLADTQLVCSVSPPLQQYENPLLFHGFTPFPPFDAIRASHIVPGMRTLLNRLVACNHL